MSELQSDLEFMRTPDAWPNWPVLPVKRYVDHKLETGVLLENSANVYYFGAGFNMWNLPKDLSVFDRIDNLQTLVDQGWIVD